MAFDKANRPEGGFKRRGGGRRRKKVCVFCGKEARSFPEELPATAQSTREL